MVLHTTGSILILEAALLLLPAVVGVIYSDPTTGAILISAGITAAAGLLLYAVRPQTKTIYAREGFIIVALSWILLSCCGALPFLISGRIPRFVDAFFETVSGFTTTGATILRVVEPLGYALLFWRSFTHWVGGMGVLVFCLVIVPMGGTRSIHIMRAEVPGPTKNKLVPKLRSTARILYGIYFGMTAIEVILLCAGGMPLYDSLINSFGSAGTGGFSCKTLSIAAYNSPYAEMVISVFMLMFGVNFNLYYLILIKRGREAFKSEELRTYLAIVAFSVITIALNIRGEYADYVQAFRFSFFQVSSIITTTGFSTTDFNLWPQYSRMLLVLLMFIGACASSTGGGIKVSRILLLSRMAKQGLRRMVHPHAVTIVQMDGKSVDSAVLYSSSVYLVLYVIIAAASTLILSADNFSFETNFSAMAACFNNVGPGLDIVGAAGNYGDFSPISKLVLSFDMLAGRLEIFPLLILFSPDAWKKRNCVQSSDAKAQA